MSSHIKRNLLMAFSGVLLVAVGFFIGTSVLFSEASNGSTVSATLPATAQLQQAQTSPALTEMEQVFADIYQRVSPSVVAISVTANRTDAFGQSGQISGAGSGFVINQNGYIVTNYHVVEGATEIVVNFLDGTVTRAEVVGLDADSDLAVIKVDLPAEQLVPVTFGNTDGLVVGETVLAIGSPFNQRWTLTSGIISALDRTIQGMSQFSIGSAIQTDTSINPGNSGGPLLNLAGQVIGVNSQILSESGSNSGIGFAIPGDLVQRVSQQIIENGQVQYTYLGIQGGDVSIDAIEALNLANNTRGVVVYDVSNGGPAADAGLRSADISQDGTELRDADIILAIDGTPLNGISSLISYLARYTSPGDNVALTVLRGGEQITLNVTLEARPGSVQ